MVDAFNINAQSNIPKQVREAAQALLSLDKAVGKLEKQTLSYNAAVDKTVVTTTRWNTANQQVVTSITKIGSAEAKVTAKVVDSTSKTNQQALAQEKLNKRRKEFAVEAKRFTKALTESSRPARQRATTGELLNFRNAQAQLREFVAANEVSGRKVNQVWKRVQSGGLQDVVGKEKELQNILVRLQQSYQTLGSTVDRINVKRGARARADEEKRATNELKKQAGQLKRVKQASDGVLLSWKTIGRLIVSSLSSRAISAFVSKIRESVQQAIELGKSIASIQTIDRAGLGFERIAASLRGLSDEFGLDVVDQARAAYQSLSNQVVSGAQTFEFLRTANQLAVTGLSTTEQSVNLLSSAINAFGLNVNNTDEIASVLFKTVELGRNKIGELSDTFGRVAVPAGQLNVSIQEVGAAIATLTRQGVKPAEAITQLNGIFLKILKPTKALRGLIQDLGFESGEAAISVLGLGGFLEEIAKATGGSSTELAKFINRARALRGALALAGDGLSEFDKNLQRIEGSSESFGNKTAIVLTNTAKRFEIEITKIQNFFTQDLAASGLDAVDRLLGGFESLSTAIKVVSEVFLIALVPAISLATASMLRFIAVSTRGAFSNPWIAVATAITLVIAGVVELIARTKTVKEEFIAASDAAKTTFLEAESARQKAIQNSDEVFKRALKDQERAVTAAGRTIRKEYSESSKRITDVFEGAGKVTKQVFSDITKALKDEIKAIDNQINGIQKSIEGVNKSISDANTGLRELAAEEAFDNLAGPREQIDALIDRINALKVAQSQAADSGQADLFSRLTNDIVDTAKELKDLQDGIQKTNEENVKKRASLERALAESRIVSAQKIAKEENNINNIHSNGQKELGKKVAAQQAIAEEIRKQGLKEADIARKLAASKIIEFKKVDIKKLAIAQLETNLRLREQINAVQRQEIDIIAEKRIAAETEFQLVRSRLKAFTPGNVDDILGAKTVEDAKRIAEGSVGVFERALEALDRLPATDVNKQRRESFEQLIELTKEAAIERGTLLKLETSEDSFKASRDRLKVEEQTLKILREQILARRKEIATSALAVRENAAQTGGLADVEKIAKRVRDGQIASRLFFDESEQFGRVLTQLFSLQLGVSGGRGVFANLTDDAKQAILQFDTLQRALERLGSGQVNQANISQVLTAIAAILGGEGGTGKNISERVPEAKKLVTELIALKDLLNSDVQGVDPGQFGVELKKADEAIFSNARAARTLNGDLGALTQQEGITKQSTDSLGTSVQNTAQAFANYAEALNATLTAIEALNNTEAPSIPNSVLPRANGGFSPKGSDRIPALLKQGEFVMSAEASSKFRSQLLSMNSGARRFANGGSVTNMSGDFNVSLNSSGSSDVDIVQVGKGIQKAVRRGLLKRF